MLRLSPMVGVSRYPDVTPKLFLLPSYSPATPFMNRNAQCQLLGGHVKLVKVRQLFLANQLYGIFIVVRLNLSRQNMYRLTTSTN